MVVEAGKDPLSERDNADHHGGLWWKQRRASQAVEARVATLRQRNRPGRDCHASAARHEQMEQDRCVTNTSSENGDVELYERWGQAPRGRQSGAGLKPLQAAAVKSGGGERCSKRRDKIPSGVVRRGERKRTADDVS